FTPNYSETVIPGEIITFTHVLTNTGDSADTFTLQMLPGSDWAELLPTNPSQVLVELGESRLIEVRVTVPPKAPAGLADTARIQAVSSFDPSVLAVVTDTVTAKPTVGTRYVAVSGRNTNNNCTQATDPCETVDYAVRQASINDDIYIASGTYLESGISLNGAIHLSGGWTSGFRVQNEPDQTILDAEFKTLILNIASGSAINPSISNLTLQNGKNGGPGGAVLVGSLAQPTFENVYFENN
ncbi:MAG: hypothetical protein GY803_17175, partial [Chloroflexi bacterium]|nr:hypothetical protein [Chloroflexota bacterium]